MKRFGWLLVIILALAARAHAATFETPLPGAPCIAIGWTSTGSWFCYVTGLNPFSPVPRPPPTGVQPGARAHFTDAMGRPEFALSDGSGRLAAIAPARTPPGPEQTAQVVAQSPNPSLQCPFVSAVSTTANVKQIAGIAGKWLHVCTIFLDVAGAENIGIIEGTGTTCGTGTTNLVGQGTSGSVATAANGGFVAVSDRIILPMQVAGDDLCVVKSAANNVSGFISYGVFP